MDFSNLLQQQPLHCPVVPPPLPLALRKEGRLAAGTEKRIFDLSWAKDSTEARSRLASVTQTGGFVWSIDGAEQASDPVALDAGTELMRVCWHPDGVRVLTGSSEGEICVCDCNSGEMQATLLASEEKDEVYGLEALTSELLAVGAGDTAQLWDLNRGTRIAETKFATAENGFHHGGEARNPDARAYLFSLAARGRAFCAALSDGTVRLLDSQTLQHIGTLKEHAARDTAAFGVAISPTSPLLATSGQDGAVLLWDFRKIGNGPLAEWDDGHGGAVHSLAFVAGVSSSGGGGGSGNGELLVSGGTERRLRIHETRTASLKVEGTASVLDSVLCVKAAPAASGGTAGPRVATAGGSGALISDAGISLWRVEEKAQLQAQAAAATSEEHAKRQRLADTSDGK